MRKMPSGSLCACACCGIFRNKQANPMDEIAKVFRIILIR